MCNRCDGGNKELIELKCNHSACEHVFYQVVEVHEEEDKTCPKCKEGKGVINEKGGEYE